MNMDNNTIIVVGSVLLAAFFGYKYLTQRLEDRFDDLRRAMMDSDDSIWRETEGMQKEIARLTRQVECCSKQKSSCNNQGSVGY